MKPIIAITHASFDERRVQSLNRLVAQLRSEAPQIPFHITEDSKARGSLWCWTHAMLAALGDPYGASHIVWLPDDAILCRDFGRILCAAIEARPDDVFDCMVNHPVLRTHRPTTPWYSTPDGYVGFGGVMPRELLLAHVHWRDEHPELATYPGYPNDAGVNLWAAMTGRLIYKTAWSLVTHDLSVPSLDGHDGQVAEGHERAGLRPVDASRKGVCEDIMNFLARSFMAPGDAGRAAAALPPTYEANIFDAVRILRPEHWDVDAMYRAYEPPPESGERVVIIVPRYHEDSAIVEATDPSRAAVEADLEAHGIECLILKPPPESHPDRMRQRATHAAMKLGPTRILWWDADIACLTPECVRAMLATGHDVVAGACPFKSTAGKVVCNLFPKTEAALSAALRGEAYGTIELDKGCIEVRDAGTGFMMVSRKALVTLMQNHPELLHLSRGEGDEGQPLWAIWDASIVGADFPDSWPMTLKSRSFDTEDWYFCRLWQSDGGKVYVYVPARFQHWGLYPYEASFEQQWGLARAG